MADRDETSRWFLKPMWRDPVFWLSLVLGLLVGASQASTIFRFIDNPYAAWVLVAGAAFFGFMILSTIILVPVRAIRGWQAGQAQGEARRAEKDAARRTEARRTEAAREERRAAREAEAEAAAEAEAEPPTAEPPTADAVAPAERSTTAEPEAHTHPAPEADAEPEAEPEPAPEPDADPEPVLEAEPEPEPSPKPVATKKKRPPSTGEKIGRFGGRLAGKAIVAAKRAAQDGDG